MKIAVTVNSCYQIGIETWQDHHITKVFEELTTLKEIDEWCKSIDTTANFSNAKISLVVE